MHTVVIGNFKIVFMRSPLLPEVILKITFKRRIGANFSDNV